MTGAVEVRPPGGVMPETEAFTDGPEWLQRFREEARERFSATGFPTTRLEEWKFTNVAPIAKTTFRAGEYKLDAGIAEIAERLISHTDAIPVVFINGKYCRKLSKHSGLPGGVKVSSLHDALRNGDHLHHHLAAEAPDTGPFVWLNAASFEDGAYVQVASGVVLERPIHLIFISSSDGGPSVSHPRNLITLGALAQASVIETYTGADGDVYFTNAVTGVIAEEGSVLTHYKVHKERDRAFHIANLQVHQGRQSNVTCHSFSFGGGLVRNDAKLVLGDGAEGVLDGLYITSGKQHVDNHTVIDHAKPHAASRELYKGVLSGHSSAVFNGKVIVRKDAQKTDAKQSNRNLLLSEEAVINTKPELQIYADDVRCTHGATIGQLEERALFYLRSRGIGQQEAREMLIRAFAQEVIARVKPDDLRGELERELDARLKAGRGAVS
jgi:Fe-S cluster assembly protein SufD